MADNILTPREIRRYSRQIMLTEIGEHGQEKLKLARVLVVGAGGLGCPILQYLTAAGVGKIGIAEFDKVEETNLQRQVLYGPDDIGKLKSIIAKSRLEHLNSNAEIEMVNLRINQANSAEVAARFDVIVDATDNIPTRYVINDACVTLNKPMVHGAIYKSEGQVSVFNYMGGPTYRCYNPEGENNEYHNPPASETGLLGVLPGITGMLMANEVIKIITGSGVILSGKVLIFNISDYRFSIIKFSKNAENHNISYLK